MTTCHTLKHPLKDGRMGKPIHTVYMVCCRCIEPCDDIAWGRCCLCREASEHCEPCDERQDNQPFDPEREYEDELHGGAGMESGK